MWRRECSITRSSRGAQALGGAALPRTSVASRLLCGTRASGGPANSLAALTQTGRPSKAPLALRSSTTSQRQVSSAQRLRVGAFSMGWVRERHLVRGNVATAAAGADAPPLSRRPRNGGPAGLSGPACLSAASLQARRWREYRSGCHFSGRRRRRCSCANRCHLSCTNINRYVGLALVDRSGVTRSSSDSSTLRGSSPDRLRARGCRCTGLAP